MRCEVTYITPRLEFTDTFLLEKNAREFFDVVKSKPFTLFASLHIDDKLKAVFTSPTLHDTFNLQTEN